MGGNQCFQIGDTLYYSTLTTTFYTMPRPKGEEFWYLGIDSQIVERLNHVTDSLSDESWYDLGDLLRVSPLRTGISAIDSSMYGACREYVAKYAVVNASSNFERRGNLFTRLRDMNSRHIVLLHVDTSTVRECQLDQWMLEKIAEKAEYYRTVVIRPKQ